MKNRGFRLYEQVLYSGEEYIIKYISKGSEIWGTSVTLTHVDYKRVIKKKLQKRENIHVDIERIEKRIIDD